MQLDGDMDLPFDLDSLEIKDPVAETLLSFPAEMEFRIKRIADKLVWKRL